MQLRLSSACCKRSLSSWRLCVHLSGRGRRRCALSATLGHRLMCVCGCNQILLECNHVGCNYSDRMRGELMAALIRRRQRRSRSSKPSSRIRDHACSAAPTHQGFNRVAWIMPLPCVVLGLRRRW